MPAGKVEQTPMFRKANFRCWLILLINSVLQSAANRDSLLPVANDDSTRSIRNTILIVNRRGRLGSAPYQADLAIENPTH